MTESQRAAEKARRRLGTSEMSRWVGIIKKKVTNLPSLGDFHVNGWGFRRGYVLYLRLSSHERQMLEVTVSDEDGCYPSRTSNEFPALAQQVASRLFLRWYVFADTRSQF